MGKWSGEEELIIFQVSLSFKTPQVYGVLGGIENTMEQVCLNLEPWVTFLELAKVTLVTTVDSGTWGLSHSGNVTELLVGQPLGSNAPALPHTTCVTLDNFLSLSASHFHHL